MHFDFALVLVVLTFFTGVVTLLDRFWLRKRRGEQSEPVLIDYCRSFFPVLLIVLVLRSFIFEPFRIPSSSMMPTLNVGDFIVVNKFAYGVRLPVLHTEILDTGEPQRGDIVVFRYPEDPSVDYIKRVVGLPGDEIRYQDKQLYVNGEPVARVEQGAYTGVGAGTVMSGADLIQENIDGAVFDILHASDHPAGRDGIWVVSPGHYFVLGDNRDRSGDSRFWGLVPEENLVGRAVMIWMNWDTQQDGVIDFSRIGTRLDKNTNS